MQLHYLAPPPRAVPLSARLTHVFGGPLSWGGWLFFAFGSVFVWAFVPHADLSSFSLEAGTTMSAARVTDCSVTNMSENKRRVNKVRFAYAGPDGAERTGVSYTTDRCPAVGEEARARLSASGAARLEGMRAAPFSAWVVPFVFIFPLAGLCLVFFGMRAGLRASRLLARGLVARAKVAAKEPTNTRINDRMVWKMTLEFTDQSGVVRRAEVKTEHPDLLEDEERETVLYDPQSPSDAVALDVLPGKVTATPGGEIEGTGLSGLAGLLGPLGAALVNAAGAYLVLLR